MCNSFYVLVETLGCRLNQTESESLAVIFAKAGFKVLSRDLLQEKLSSKINSYQKLEEAEFPLLCIVNTCTVTSKAEQKARHLIRFLLKQNKQAIILVTGCYAELDAEKIEEMDERILTFQGKKKDALLCLPQYIIEYCNIENSSSFNIGALTPAVLKKLLISFKAKYEKMDTAIPCEHVASKKVQFGQDNFSNIVNSTFIPLFALSAPNFMFHSRATLKVQDGCNNICSFCRIRLARGNSISLPMKEACNRIKEIEEKGASEVVITGVNLSQYKDGNYDFSHLLEHLLVSTSNIKIRISSLYPENITPSFLSVASNNRICSHFHLSIQSGSDRILKKMGRRYTKETVYEAVQALRKIKGLPFIGCDIIAGFPSETEEDFFLTLQLCNELKFAGIHAFPFSPRPGTLSFNMKEKVSERIARNRVTLLSSIAKRNYEEYLESFEGITLFAILEVSKRQFFVTTENYLHLPLKAKNEHKAGDGLFVRIVGKKAVEV